MITYTLLALVLLAAGAYVVGRSRGRTLLRSSSGKVHSLPGYHGAYVALTAGLPALFLVLAWALLQGPVLNTLITASLSETTSAGKSASELALLVAEVRNVAAGRLFSEPTDEIRAIAARLENWRLIADWAILVLVVCGMLIGLVVARARLSPRFRARNTVEQILSGLMIGCSVVAIVTTLGIFVSLVYEATAFFRMVPLHEFLFGLRWEPQIALRADQVAGQGAFGAVPVVLGTLVISSIALFVAVPTGIFTAIYLAEFASETVRAVVKPVLEILAGIPTVVFGFFAILVVAPAVRQFAGSFGLSTSSNSALAAGLVMGIMIIPFVSSLSDDAIRSVPRSLRDGSLALGATPAETMTKVILPAALPGIMGGILLAASRAIGETMIVAMAAGLIASLTINPLDSVTTVTVQIVTLLTGDSEFDSPKTLAAFALGLLLFCITLVLNIVALSLVRRYREQYD